MGCHFFYFLGEKSPARVAKVPAVTGSRLLFWTWQKPATPTPSSGYFSNADPFSNLLTKNIKDKTVSSRTRSSGYFVVVAQPTNPLSQEGRRWETKQVMRMAYIFGSHGRECVQLISHPPLFVWSVCYNNGSSENSRTSFVQMEDVSAHLTTWQLRDAILTVFCALLLSRRCSILCYDLNLFFGLKFFELAWLLFTIKEQGFI